MCLSKEPLGSFGFEQTPLPISTTHTHSYHHPAQLLDGQRAVRLVRSRLRPGVDDAWRVGVVGSSAGACFGLIRCGSAYRLD